MAVIFNMSSLINICPNRHSGQATNFIELFKIAEKIGIKNIQHKLSAHIFKFKLTISNKSSGPKLILAQITVGKMVNYIKLTVCHHRYHLNHR